MDDAVAGVADARADMESMVLDATIYSLTERELSFLIAMLPDAGISRMSDIARRLEASASNASHYRRRLLNQGVISEAGHGKVEFSMPMLKELLQEHFG
jgi:predicted transcriptional regulator